MMPHLALQNTSNHLQQINALKSVMGHTYTFAKAHPQHDLIFIQHMKVNTCVIYAKSMFATHVYLYHYAKSIFATYVYLYQILTTERKIKYFTKMDVRIQCASNVFNTIAWEMITTNSVRIWYLRVR